MKRKRYTPEKIITMLREAELLSSKGTSINEISRKLSITEQTDNVLNLESSFFFRYTDTINNNSDYQANPKWLPPC